MTLQEIADYRLLLQQLHSSRFTSPHDLVSYLGAMQAQDYLSAQWALGMRLASTLHDTDIDTALADGSIIRTHVMRPTWHFVAPEDLGWMQMLTAHRVRKIADYYNRQLELDEGIFKKANSCIQKALANNTYLTREELRDAIETSGVSVGSGQRLGNIMFEVELSNLVCSGPRRGKQFTYALVSERIKNPTILTKDEALEELTRRYFTSHGPATIKDFSWWSGLTLADGKRGIAMLGSAVNQVAVGSSIFYYLSPLPDITRSVLQASLQPAYDEYTIAYQNHEVHFPEEFSRKELGYGYFILLNGQISGIWQRVVKGATVQIGFKLFRDFSVDEMHLLRLEAERYAEFVQKKLVLI